MRNAAARWPSRMSRRHLIGAGASVLLLGSPPGASAQGAPRESSKRPHPEPSSGRDASSWFLISRPDEASYITNSNRFEVYNGRTFDLLGGFPSAGTWSAGVTADPAKILLDTLFGPSIFDLETGNLAKVAWDTDEDVARVRLPDPRWAPPTPPRWSFFTSDANMRALLVDLHHATGVDLAEMLVRPGESEAYPAIRFSPDNTLATASVTYNGFYLLDPEVPADARLLDGGRPDLVSWGPDFSPDSSRLAYVLREPESERGPGALVVEELDGGDIVEIGPVSPDGFATFPPDSNDDLIVFDAGAITRREIQGGREIWRTGSEHIAFAFGVTGTTLFLGSAAREGGTPVWQTVALATGESRELVDLRGLTYYNTSYFSPEPAFQLMGPPNADGGNTDPIGHLAVVNLESAAVTTLLEETSGLTSLAYATSRDGGTIYYRPIHEEKYYLFDLASSEQQTFTYDEQTTSLRDPAVSADGAAAGFTQWTTSDSGRMEAWLIDIAGGGAPEPFLEGRLWCWAGGTPVPGATAGTRGNQTASSGV